MGGRGDPWVSYRTRLGGRRNSRITNRISLGDLQPTIPRSLSRAAYNTQENQKGMVQEKDVIVHHHFSRYRRADLNLTRYGEMSCSSDPKQSASLGEVPSSKSIILHCFLIVKINKNKIKIYFPFYHMIMIFLTSLELKGWNFALFLLVLSF